MCYHFQQFQGSFSLTYSIFYFRVSAPGKLLQKGPSKNSSVVGQLLLGKPLDYSHLIAEWGYPSDENFKIYPTEKKDWATIRQETLRRRRQLSLNRRSKCEDPASQPAKGLAGHSRASVRSQYGLYTTSTGSQSFFSVCGKRGGGGCGTDSDVYQTDRK